MTTEEPKDGPPQQQNEPSPLLSLLSLPLRSYSPLTPRARSVVSTSSVQAQDGDAVSSGEERTTNAVMPSDTDTDAFEREGPLSATLRQLGVKKTKQTLPLRLPVPADRKSIASPGVFAHQQHIQRQSVSGPDAPSSQTMPSPSPRQVGRSHTVVAGTPRGPNTFSAHKPSPLSRVDERTTRSLSLTRGVPGEGVRSVNRSSAANSVNARSSSLRYSTTGRSNSLRQSATGRSNSLRGATTVRSNSLEGFAAARSNSLSGVTPATNITLGAFPIQTTNSTATLTASKINIHQQAPTTFHAFGRNSLTPANAPNSDPQTPSTGTTLHSTPSKRIDVPAARGPDGWGGLLPPTGWFPENENIRGPLVSPLPARKTKMVRFASVVPSLRDVLGVQEQQEEQDGKKIPHGVDVEFGPQYTREGRRVKMRWIYLLLVVVCIALALCVGFGVAWQKERGRTRGSAQGATITATDVSTRSVEAAPTTMGDSAAGTPAATASMGHPTAVASALSLAGRG